MTLSIGYYNTTKGALEKLLMANNRMASKEAGKALAEALTANSTLKELDVSSNTWTELRRPKGDGPGFAQELADGVKNNGALAKFTFSGYDGFGEGPPVTMEAPMVEADFSCTRLGPSGAIMLAAFLPKCRYVQEYPSVRPLIYFLPSGR